MKRTIQGLGVLAAILVLAVIPAKRTGAQQSVSSVDPGGSCAGGGLWNFNGKIFACRGGHWEDVVIINGSPLPSPSTTPFDVPPVVTHGPGSHWVTSCVGDVGPCSSDIRELDVHRTCKDKSRFLLMSEDGKYHCLRLGQ